MKSKRNRRKYGRLLKIYFHIREGVFKQSIKTRKERLINFTMQNLRVFNKQNNNKKLNQFKRHGVLRKSIFNQYDSEKDNFPNI